MQMTELKITTADDRMILRGIYPSYAWAQQRLFDFCVGAAKFLAFPANREQLQADYIEEFFEIHHYWQYSLDPVEVDMGAEAKTQDPRTVWVLLIQDETAHDFGIYRSFSRHDAGMDYLASFVRHRLKESGLFPATGGDSDMITKFFYEEDSVLYQPDLYYQLVEVEFNPESYVP